MNISLIKAIRKNGIQLTVTKGENRITGRGIIVPFRNVRKSDGGISHDGSVRTDPHRCYIYTESDILKDTVRGDTVSDGQNEYYILWTDEYRSRYGNYIKAAAKICS